MFVEMLSHRCRGVTGRAWSAPAAFALHALALAAALAASLSRTGEEPEPRIPVIYREPRSAPAGSGAPASGGPARSSGATIRSPAVARAIPTETTALGTLPIEARLSSSSAGLSAANRAHPGGSGSENAGGGLGDSPGTGDDPFGDEPDPGRIFQPGGDVGAPRLVHRVEPAYPEAARKARLEGTVVLEAIITANGLVEDVRIVKSAGVLLDASAEEAVRRWRYRPGTLNGRPVRVALTVTVAFRLH